MARSLQELIDFLLNEVALCGDQGVSFAGILQKVDIFYRSDDLLRRQNVDRRFQAKVWSWLTRRPDVLVGKKNEWRHLTFDQVLALDRPVKANGPAAESPAPVTEASIEASAEPSAGQNAENEATGDSPTISKVRIFVSKERAWYAITGHEPDILKVPASEFALLSIIAAQKSEGITQTDLVTASGQDKRSVPKRTDALAAKGYIEKRKIQIRKHRTSLLTLRRFLNAPPTEIKEEEGQKIKKAQMIDFGDLNRKLFGILETSENHIIGRNDLKDFLDYKTIWYSRILSRAIRKWEELGVLRRVRAKSQYGKFYDCVERVRVPTETDFERFHQFNKNESNKVGPDHADPGEEMEPEGDDGDAMQVDTDEAVTSTRAKEKRATEKIVASWTPDRNISNQLFDIIDNAGTNGITNNLISRHCFGLYYRRPAECLFHRLTDCWQYSQPPHLRHLAVVRDSDVHKTIIHYVQYSATNFGKKVEQGNAFWEAVEFHPGKHKPTKVKIPPIHAPYEVDEYGLPTILPPFLTNDGNISLFEGIASCKPSDYSLTSRDLVGVYYADGSYKIEPGSTLTKVKPSLTPSGRSIAKKGRPRLLDDVPTTPSRSSKKQKREVLAAPEDHDDDEIMIDMIHIPSTMKQSHKKSQSKYEKYKHLGEKERFEKMGMDETWTEYKALVMEKPTPGCYVTPPGKRRPEGKKQGRPKNSRIAVFKLPGLSNFEWFTKDETGSDRAAASDTLQPVEQSPAVPPTPTPQPESSQIAEPTPSRPGKGKRAQAAAGSPDEGAPSESGRPAKQRRLRGPGNENDQQTGQKEAANGQGLVDLTANTRNNTPAAVQTDPQEKDKPVDQEQPESSQTGRVQLGTPGTTPKPTGSRKMVTPLPRSSVSQAIPTSKSQSETKMHFSADRGGSVPFMRRRIIMDILEKAGGAYPAGSELWYPFATAWMKLDYQEKPDSRTLARTIGHLVDAGQIHKMTYSAKDTRGIMATKTILRKPEIAPEDPLILRMQSELAIFDRDMRIPFAPGIEINQSLSKHTNGVIKKTKATIGRHTTSLPLVTDSFRLRTKPPAVVRQEEKNRRRVEKEWQDQLYRAKYMMGEISDEDDEEVDYGDYDDDDDEEDDEEEDEQDAPGIRYRLIRFPPQMNHGSDFGTHLFRPNAARGGPRPPKIKRTPGRPRMLDNVFSISGKMAFLMNPGQIFSPATGTFGTGSIHHKKRGSMPFNFADLRANVHLQKPDHVNVLMRLARQHYHPTTAKGWSNTDTGRFARVTDRILRWELEHEDMFDATYKDHPFIEQYTSRHFYSPPLEGPIRFDFEQAKPPARTKKVRIPKLRPRTERQPSKRERKPKNPKEPRPPLRRRANIRPLHEGLIRKYMAAIVAVRTLAGGNQGSNVDWDLVPLAFPDTPPDRAVQIARSILGKNRMEIHKMQHDFQERYILAYQQDKVPPIDYRHLAGYDWKAVVEWASVELEFSTSEKVPTLPATREQFDSMFELREESANAGEEVHTTTSGLTVANKRRLMARIPFAVEQPRRTPPSRKEHYKRLEVAKTWVRANVTTHVHYDPVAARAKLEEFGSILSEATQSLVTDRVICTANRGRAVPGRNYMMHDFFLQAMERRRGIDSVQLVRAAEFKTSVLDPAFEKYGTYKIDYHGPDGDAVALEELAAKAHIELVPINPPQMKYGLMEGGYLTRQMDKDVLRFEMQARPLPSYPYGNPILSLIDDTPIPKSTPAGHCPLWIDVHGRLIPQWWRKAVASVLGCIVLRAGVSADAIVFMVKPGMMKWEVELLLEEWLLKVGVVRKSESQGRSLWSLNEWWWMVLKKPEAEEVSYATGVSDALDAPALDAPGAQSDAPAAGASDAPAPLPIDPMLAAS